MSKIIGFFVFCAVIVWAILCAPLAIVLFYIKESHELAKMWSSFFDKILKQ